MQELGIAGLISVLLGLSIVEKPSLKILFLKAGLALIVIGLALGVPSGALYHWRLYRTLRNKMTLPNRWWLNPIKLHNRLTPEEFNTMSFAFKAGAVGFFLTMGGCLLFFLGLL